MAKKEKLFSLLMTTEIVRKYKHWMPTTLLIVLFTLSLSAGCSNTELTSSTLTSQSTSQTAEQTTSSQPVQLSTSLDAYNLILSNKDNPEFVILDVRSADSFKTAHIPNAINVPYSPDYKTIVGLFDKNKPYLIYCKNGVTSAPATQTMTDLGFKYLYNFPGGIDQWVLDGYPVISDNSPTISTTSTSTNPCSITTTSTNSSSVTTSNNQSNFSQIEVIQNFFSYNQTD